MVSPGIPPLPSSPSRLPHELLARIFSHCDPPSLAAVAGVSLACLELSAKILYEDVVLTSLNQIISLFRLSVSVSSSFCGIR